MIKTGDNEAQRLIPHETGNFKVNGSENLEVRFIADEDKCIQALYLIEGQTHRHARKVEKEELHIRDYKYYEGRYYSEELETYYEILVADGTLLLRHRRNEDIPLIPVIRDRFSALIWWLQSVEFFAEENSGVKNDYSGNDEPVFSFYINGSRVRHLYFRSTKLSRHQ